MQISKINEATWYRLHWTMLLFGFGKVIRSAIIPLLIFGYAAQKGTRFFLFFIVIAGIILPIFALFLRFLSFRFQMQGGHIRIREGIFSKKVRSIPVKRIHNINTSQSPLARLLKVSRLDIETAGGGAAEASFSALSFPTVRQIREFVHREKRKEPGDELKTGTPRQRTKTIFRIRIMDILIAGATTNRMGVILVALAALFQYVEEYSLERMPQWIQGVFDWASTLREQDTTHLVSIAILLFFLLFLSAWLISIVMALIRWHRFTLTENGTDLHIRSGLFTIREYTIPRDKIQALRFRITPIRRPFRLAEIRVQSAGHVGLENQSRSESDVLAPITRVKHGNRFVRAVWPRTDWERVPWQPVHPYTRTRQFRILSFIWLLLLALAWFWIDEFPLKPHLMAGSLIAGLPLAWLIAHLTFKQTAFAHDMGFVYIKAGFIGLHFWVIPRGRVQNLAIHQTPFQRRRRLASLSLDVAGGSVSHRAIIPNIELQRAWLLLNRFGHPVFK